MTRAGVILGTAAYMAPEQARGSAADKRADLWAFGVVLYEMLTGTRPFDGATVSDTLAHVLTKEPDWAALPVNTPAAIRRLLRRSLEKDRRQRTRDVGDVRLEIDEALNAPPVDVALARPASRWPWGVAAAALLVAVALAWRGPDRTRPTPVYVSLDAPVDTVLGEDDELVPLPIHTPMVFTPDGRSLIIQAAHAGKPQVFLRSLDRAHARPIAGTDDARVPFVSPDGKWVGFWAANEIRKVPIEGGAPRTICSLKTNLGPNGAAWGASGVIVFGDDYTRQIMRVSALGGVPEPVTAQAPPPRRHVTPFLLPDGKRVLYADVSASDANDARLMVQSLDGGGPHLVMASATDGRLLPGQLVFMRLGTLMTVGFDLGQGVAIGDPVDAMHDVMQSGLRVRAGANHPGAGMFAVSSLGTLAAIRGPVTGGEGSHMVWVTRAGDVSSAEPAAGAPAGGRLLPRISPDGSRAVVGVGTPTRGGELWIADWARNVWTACPGCTAVTSGQHLAWSPDGRRLLLEADDKLIAHVVDGSAPDQVMVVEPKRTLLPAEWLPDGRIVYLSESEPDAADADIKVLNVGGNAGHAVAVGTRPAVSPDGRWVAFDSIETGRENVIVQAFPGPGPRIQVSAGGGTAPAWSPDGRTLYYLERPPGEPLVRVLAVSINTARALTAGTPRELFRRPGFLHCADIRCYDLSADGQRFLWIEPDTAPRASVTRMDLVLNWTATLPTGR